MSDKTQRIQIDLKKNTDLADLVADLEPGESIYAELSIVAKDEQTLTVEVEAAADTPEDLAGGEDKEPAADETTEVDEAPAEKSDAPADS